MDYGRTTKNLSGQRLCVFRCIEVVQISHSKCKPWVWVLPESPSFVSQLPEMHVVEQSPGVLERSLDVGDVLVLQHQ